MIERAGRESASNPTWSVRSGGSTGFVAECGAASTQGRGRRRNEDACLVALPRLAVADGVGGERSGHFAAGLAIAALASQPGGDPRSELRHAFIEAQAAVLSLASDGKHAGAATTMTAGRFVPGGIWVAHIGDSRAYRLRSGRLEQLTTDHILVEELRQRGVIGREKAEEHPLRSMLTKGLGVEPGRAADPDLFRVDLEPGDTVLLCTDGFSNCLDPVETVAGLTAPGSLALALEKLVDTAQRRGTDDVTAVAARLSAG